MHCPDEFRIRRGEDRDIAELAGFNICMAQETENIVLESEIITNGVRSMVEHPERGFYLVVETGQGEDAFIVASLMITMEWSDWRNGMFWWIQSVYVLPDYRRRGLYRRLYDHVRELASQSRGICGFRLYVEKDNQVAQTTYRSLGMSETEYRLYEQLIDHD